MKLLNIFFFSAVLYFIANNLHFVSDTIIVPRFCDLLATAALIFGFILRFRNTNN